MPAPAAAPTRWPARHPDAVYDGQGRGRILADALFKVLSNPGHNPDPAVPGGTPAALAGTWVVSIQYSCGMGEQHFALKQNGGAMAGDHKGEIYNGTLQGTIHGDQVRLRSNMVVPGNGIHWTFDGRCAAIPCRAKRIWANMAPPRWSATKA